MDKKKKVGILTTFAAWDTAYSLVGVVSQQLEALVKYGYKPVLFVLNNFKDDNKLPEGVEVRKIVPQLILEPYSAGEIPPTFSDDVGKVQAALNQHMQDIEIVLAHDIFFINSYLPYNIGAKNAELPNAKWLCWMHSGPSLRPSNLEWPWENLYSLPARSRLVYMNYTDRVRAAEMYGLWDKDVRTIFNPMDPRVAFRLHPLTIELINKYKILESEVIDIYPLSTTRMNDNGKQLSKVVTIMGHIKKQGKSVKLIVPNAHANDKREKNEIAEMLGYAYASGLSEGDVVFTSLHDAPKYELGVPHEVVMDLFQLSNVFIFPSVSENCPLVLLEAALTKNLLILNASFPAMKDFVREHAFYFNFGSLVDTPKFPNGEDQYLSDVAKIIISELNRSKNLNAFTKIKNDFNFDKIFKLQIEPIFHEEDWE